MWALHIVKFPSLISATRSKIRTARIETHEVLHNLSIPANTWQDPASIDIQWSQPIECQCWQDPARNWQEISNYAKTRLIYMCWILYFKNLNVNTSPYLSVFYTPRVHKPHHKKNNVSVFSVTIVVSLRVQPNKNFIGVIWLQNKKLSVDKLGEKEFYFPTVLFWISSHVILVPK